MKNESKKTIKDALDVLSLALAGHNHAWTNKERSLYEEAIYLLGENDALNTHKHTQ
jgi:hypothetical protein